ncbi:hypothetical protein PILCRDRAFT_822524 [Piloderma croceum F 1598]|uniref:Galactose mutarotase-like protein n=1 Tax=Piloderma croceum (strain F 1598) TaxID=765440 RepID=A0A0C3BSS0_PILCF|nr:hypothetical protein PILCRDRAFT_822524 [Piloderma croceum F 1598]
MSDFKPVLLALPSLTPSLAVEILPRGLTIHRIFVQEGGRTHDIVVGPEKPEDHLRNKYTNTLIGRYTNRLPVGTHSIERKIKEDEIACKINITAKNEGDTASLHGGAQGFDSLPLTLLSSSSESTLFTKAELISLATHIPGESSSSIWRLVSEDGDQGFPGQLTVEVLVALKEGSGSKRVEGDWEELALGSIIIVYRARVQGKNCKPVVTPINLTQHWGFNLDASLEKKDPSVLKHSLIVKASHTIERDADDLPTGNLLPVAGAHVHNGKKIEEGFPSGGYDDFYMFSKPALSVKRINLSDITKTSVDLLEPILSSSGETESVVELSSDESGLRLTFSTNQTGVQFYSNNYASPGGGTRKKIHGGSGNVGDGYGPGSAAFLEFHEPLAAFLFPQFQKNKDDTLLASDEVYHNFVKVDVAVRHLAPAV